MAQLLEDCAAGRLIPSQRYGTVPKWVERAAAAAEAARTTATGHAAGADGIPAP